MANSKQNKQIIGWISLISAITLFSTIEIASKGLSKVAKVDVSVLVFLRFFVTGIVLLAISAKTLKNREEKLGWRDHGWFALNGFIGISVAITLFHVAILKFTNASSAAVVFSVNPVFVTLIAPFLTTEKWSSQKIIGGLIGAVGVAFFSMESGEMEMSSLSGLSLMLLSAFLFALSICISKRVISRYGAMVFMGFSALYASVFLFPSALAAMDMNQLEQIKNGFWLLSYIIIFGTAMGYGLYYLGLHNTTAQGGSMSFFLKPVLASILSVLILKENFNIYSSAGTGLIVAGLLLAVVAPIFLTGKEKKNG